MQGTPFGLIVPPLRWAHFSFMGGKGGTLWKQLTYRLDNKSNVTSIGGGYLSIEDSEGLVTKTCLEAGFFDYLNKVNRKIDLVYGGGSVGLMGLISQRVYEGGCRVLGVIPKALAPVEISGEAVWDVKIVADMHERKAEMARESEAFIALPGGMEPWKRHWR